MAQYFNILQLNAAILYPFALNFGAEAMVSIKRIEEFLQKDEKNETEFGLERRNSLVLADTKRKFSIFLRQHIGCAINFNFIHSENSVEINDVSATWDEESNRKTLQNINLKIRPGQLCAIIGPVGAGKVILNEF